MVLEKSMGIRVKVKVMFMFKDCWEGDTCKRRWVGEKREDVGVVVELRNFNVISICCMF